MRTVALILTAAALTYVTCLAAGTLLARALRIRVDQFLTFVSGAAVLSFLVFLLTAADQARLGSFLVLAALLLILARPRWRCAAPPVLFWLAFVPFALLYLSQATAPEASPDGVTYHVGLIARYYREHRFPPSITSFFASFPQAIEMLFLFAYSIGNHSAAAMVEFLFLIATPFGILAWARRIGRPVAGVIGALLFFLAPVAGRDGTVAYIDVATAAIGFALFSTLQLWRENRSIGLMALAGLLAGFGFAAKYTQVVAVAYGVALIVYWTWRRWNELARALGVFALGVIAMAAPWLIKNAIEVANPVSPMLNRVFPNQYVYESEEKALWARGRNLNGVPAWRVPLELTASNGRFDGIAGPLFLAAPLALLALANPAGRQALLAAAVFALPFFGNFSARMLLPALLFLSIAIGLALERWPKVAAVAVALHALTCWPPVVNRLAPDSWHIRGMNWDAALRRIPERDYLTRHVPGYELGLIMRDRVPAGSLVLSGTYDNSAYQPHPLIRHFDSALGSRAFAALNQVMYPGKRATRRFTFRFAERPLSHVRLSLTECGAQIWAISEMRVWSRGAELARDPAWRLTAWPNPWDVTLAFDNSPITAWSAQENAPSEAHIQVDFPTPRMADAVTADLAAELSNCTMRLDIPAEVTVDQVPPPARIRRAIIEELKANRIHWMVVGAREPYARDLLEHQNDWGVTAIAYEGGFRLWFLN